MSFLVSGRSVECTPADPTNLTVERQIFSDILRHAMYAVGFSEDAYLNRYADVRDAVALGHVKSGLEHFANHGFFEGRSAVETVVDPAYYLENNLDVKEHVEKGSIPSAQVHFEKFGRSEGRLPHEGYRTDPDRLAAIIDGTPAVTPPRTHTEWWEAAGPVIPTAPFEVRQHHALQAKSAFTGLLARIAPILQSQGMRGMRAT